MGLLIRNIKGLVQAYRQAPTLCKGKNMQELPVLEDAWLLIEAGRIADFGPMAKAPERAEEMIDATGRFALPCWCDSHTHLVFAASREGEFVDRIKGLSYEVIAQRGGGILNSAEKTNAASEQELFDSAWQRLEEIKSFGTGAVEIKSGYALTAEGELKMLRVIRRLKAKSDLAIKATFLGAHALPKAYQNDRAGYLRLLTDTLIPQVAREGLADYVDAFCEKGFFTVEETDCILEAGVKHGLTPKVHVNQFNALGGIETCVKHGARSVDHLEVVEAADIEALQNSTTIPTLLPSCAFFLNIPYPPARKLVEAGLPIALATDYNPGSTPSGNMPFVLSLACIKQRLLPQEAIHAATVNGAHAMDVQDRLGSITPGHTANVILTKPIPSLEYLPYAFGSHLVEQVVINGKTVFGI